MNLTLEEMQEDLRLTEQDEKLCNEIAERISRFMHESGGEDRSCFRTDLLRYRSLSEQAAALKPRILAQIELKKNS